MRIGNPRLIPEPWEPADPHVPDFRQPDRSLRRHARDPAECRL